MDIVVGHILSSPGYGETALALRMSQWTLATADEYTSTVKVMVNPITHMI